MPGSPGGAEESPGSTGIRCRITAGGGDPRESATENKPPVQVAATRPAGKGETVRQERTAPLATGAAGQTPPGARPNRGGRGARNGAGAFPPRRPGWSREARRKARPRGMVVPHRPGNRRCGQNPAYRPSGAISNSLRRRSPQERNRNYGYERNRTPLSEPRKNTSPGREMIFDAHPIAHAIPRHPKGTTSAELQTGVEPARAQQRKDGMSFLGTHQNRLDAKGRVSVPAPFRAALRSCDAKQWHASRAAPLASASLHRSLAEHCIRGVVRAIEPTRFVQPGSR